MQRIFPIVLSCCVVLAIVAIDWADASDIDRENAPGDMISVAQYLKNQPKPQFRQGHRLASLTRFGWTLPIDARIELARDWGYALEFGGYVTEAVAARLEDPNSVESRLVALAASDPQMYRLGVICSRELPKEVPPKTWTRTADGKFIAGNGEVWEPNHTGKPGRRIWSPEAPDAVFREAGRLRADPLRKVRAKAPIAVILNGGEYALSVPGHHARHWQRDPHILEAKGDRSWFAYTSERKAHQEMIISQVVRKAVPDRELYIYYPCGGGTHRGDHPDWDQWCWGYEWMEPISDLPSNESYYLHYNTGWTGKRDMLTMVLNAKGFEIARGRPLSYSWLCAGWPRAEHGDRALGDIDRYTGFLKCLYTTGMIGANAGYYAYPEGGFDAKFLPDRPPHWLQQMMALAHVHALFSHLEEFLWTGDLLPGPDTHRWSKHQPAYKIPTGDAEVRVLARKKRQSFEWLITAWAAGGQERTVQVEIPNLGSLSIAARPCGSVYTACEQSGGTELNQVD